MRMRKKFKLKGEDCMILQTDDNTDTAKRFVCIAT